MRRMRTWEQEKKTMGRKILGIKNKATETSWAAPPIAVSTRVEPETACNDAAAVGTGLQGRQVRVGGEQKKGLRPDSSAEKEKSVFFFLAGPDKICCDPSGATLKGGRGGGIVHLPLAPMTELAAPYACCPPYASAPLQHLHQKSKTHGRRPGRGKEWRIQQVEEKLSFEKFFRLMRWRLRMQGPKKEKKRQQKRKKG